MRAFVVEFGGADDRGTVLGQARELRPAEIDPGARGQGALAERSGSPREHDRTAGEPS
jgi:hypothetical protein